MKTTGHNIKWDHFDILASGKTDFHCKTRETLLIQAKEKEKVRGMRDYWPPVTSSEFLVVFHFRRRRRPSVHLVLLGSRGL